MYKINERSNNITSADLILGVDQIEVAEFFLECKVELDINICSPLRTDPQPGCRFTVDDEGILTLFDYSRGTSYNLISMISVYKEIEYDDAKKLIINKFLNGVPPENRVVRTLTPREKRFDLKVAYRPFCDADFSLWNIAPDIKVTEKDFIKYHVHALEVYTINDKAYNLTGPSYLFDMGVAKQIYRPDLPKKSDSFVGRYRSNTSKGLYGVSFLKDDWYVVITKSYRDWFYLQKLGVNSLFVLSEGHVFTEEELRLLLKYKVFVLYDNDTTGIEKSFQLTALGFTPMFLPVNDVVDSIKAVGGRKTKNYILKKVNDQKQSRIR
jgi:hypothetical protein